MRRQVAVALILGTLTLAGLTACGTDSDDRIEHVKQAAQDAGLAALAPAAVVGRWELLKDADYERRSVLIVQDLLDEAIERRHVDPHNTSELLKFKADLHQQRRDHQVVLRLDASGTCALRFGSLKTNHGRWRLEGRVLTLHSMEGAFDGDPTSRTTGEDVELEVVGESGESLRLRAGEGEQADYLVLRTERK